MARNNSKKNILEKLLLERDWEGLYQWWNKEKSVQRMLLSKLFDGEPLIKWRAIEALGKIAAIMAEKDMLRVQDLLHRLFWGMNDESGNLYWHAPEAIAEILVNVPRLIPEYALILVSFIDVEPFPVGVHRAIARITSVEPDAFQDGIENIMKDSLNSKNPNIRVYAALTLSNINHSAFLKEIEILKTDSADIEVYDFKEGLVLNTTVGDFLQNETVD